MRMGPLLGVLTALAGPAHAEEVQAIDRILDFVSNGCVQAVATGTSARGFATRAGAQPAAKDLAASLLGKDDGAVFVRDDPRYPIALTERVNGPCSVNARFPTADLDGPVAAIHDFIAGPGSRFYEARVFEEAAGTNWVTHRVYVGRRGQKTLTLLFSTHPEAGSLDQVAVTVAADDIAPR